MYSPPAKSRQLLLQSQVNLLARMRVAAERQLDELEKESASPPVQANGPAQENGNRKPGTGNGKPAKESAVAELGKLMQVLVKLLPAERETCEIAWKKTRAPKTASKELIDWTLEELLLFERFIEEQKRFLLLRDQPK